MIMRALMLSLVLLPGLLSAAGHADAADPEHGRTDWAALLAGNVHWNAAGTATTVDYAGFARDRAQLDRYLQHVAAVRNGAFQSWPKAEREAFLINAYNAATVQLVLSRYPGIESIKDLGNLLRSPWKRSFVDILGKRRSLDDIEHELLRGAPDFNDPRIHFAINCASIGCPALRPEPYTGARLDAQLDDQTRRFLRDRSRNRYDSAKQTMRVSRIFDWYADDFTAHAGGVGVFLSHYGKALDIDASTVLRLRNGGIAIEYLDYDWSLNGVRR